MRYLTLLLEVARSFSTILAVVIAMTTRLQPTTQRLYFVSYSFSDSIDAHLPASQPLICTLVNLFLLLFCAFMPSFEEVGATLGQEWNRSAVLSDPSLTSRATSIVFHTASGPLLNPGNAPALFGDT